MAKYKVPAGYEIRFKDVMKTHAEQYAKGGRAARFGNKYDAKRCIILKGGSGKYDYAVAYRK